MSLSDLQLERYARHIVLREIGGEGQRALLAAHVAVIGAGGIGSPVIQYLAAAGVGRLTIIDDDRVDLSNLQRQLLFSTTDTGKPKAGRAAEVVAALNPDVAVEVREERIDTDNAETLVAGANAIVDGSDNFATRLAVADAAQALRIPLISASVAQFEGQLAVYRGWEPDRPCYRCLVGADPGIQEQSCAEQGVLGAMAGVMGSLAAMEAIRAITGFGEDSTGKLLLVDALSLRMRLVGVPKDPGVQPVPGLTIVVAGTDQERFHAALSLAAANAALSLRSRLFLQGDAASLLRDLKSGADERRRSAGIPTLGDLVDEALALGVEIVVCQSGLALAGMSAEELPPHVTTGGLVELLATCGSDQLVMA